MFEELKQQINEWAQDFLTRDLLPEAIALIIILLLGLLMAAILKRILNRLDGFLKSGQALEFAPWLQSIIQIGVQAVRPFSFWVFGHVAITLFTNNGWPSSILEYIIPFFGLWLLYRLLAGASTIWLKPEQVHLWRDQILRPTILVLAVMHVIGLLDGILAFQINFTKDVSVTVGALLGGLFILYIFILLGRWVRGLLRDVALPRLGADPSIIPIIATFSSYMVILVGVFVGLLVAGVDLTAVAVILGGLSVGIGFGMQELVNNFISGFILLFERSLTPGDIIETSDASGVVKDIRLRTTHIRTFDNLELIVPNGQLLSGTLINYSQKEGSPRKRIHITIGASYNDNPHEVLAALRETAVDHSGVLSQPEPQVFLTEFGDNSINYELRAWVADANMMFGVSSTLRLAIWDMFASKQFEMPYPQRDVHIIAAAAEPKIAAESATSDYQGMEINVSEPPEGLDDVD